MKESIKELLLPYQIDHVDKIVESLRDRHICFDTSDTGTGKTYISIATAKCFKYDVFVVCTKSILSQWQKVAKYFNVNILGIANYELLIKCKYYSVNKNDTLKRTECPYITHEDGLYKWNLPEHVLIIFDEVHRATNPEAFAGQLLLSLKNVYDESHKLLLISATLCESSHKFRIYAILLHWFQYQNNAPYWLEPTYNPVHANKIIKERLSAENIVHGLRLSNLKEYFQQNSITCNYYDIQKNTEDEIETLHSQIMECLQNLESKTFDDKKGTFVKIIKYRQKIELLKVEIFVELTKEYLDNNFSVIIFVNYTETLKLLCRLLRTECVIYGEQTLNVRLKNIDDFIKDRKRIIICNIASGGESISLNDKNGTYKRISLISPPMSSIKLIQSFGRNCRADSKSNSFNIVVYANTLTERNLCEKIKKKCPSHTLISDNDLTY